jgi:hypothetical protein
VIAVHDVGTDHRFAPYLQTVGPRAFIEAHRTDIDGEGAARNRSGIVAVACGNGAVDRHIDDGFTIGRPGDDEAAGAAAFVIPFTAGDRPLSLERTEVAHRRGLAGESKMLLDFTRRGHDSGAAMLGLEVVEDFLLADG